MALLKKGDNKITASENVSFKDSGLTKDNCLIVHEAGSQPKSFNPAHNLNSLKKFSKGKEYVIRMKQDFEIPKL